MICTKTVIAKFCFPLSGQIFFNYSKTAINGICVPSTCSIEKVVAFANSFLNQAGMLSPIAKCQTSESPELEIFDIFAM